MKDLIQISNQEGKQVVNARQLHSALEVKTRFNDWIQRRIEEYTFTKNEDFTTVTQNRVGGGNQTDYALTLDMAKELAMVEKTAKGRKIRQYFIEVEKQAKQPALISDAVLTVELRALASQEKQLVKSLQRVRSQKAALQNMPVQCPKCGFWAKNNLGLRAHKCANGQRFGTLKALGQ